MAGSQKIHVIVLATNPEAGRGGIAQALGGFFRAIRLTGLNYTFIATHSATAPGGRWKPWIKSFGSLRRARRDARRAGETPVAFIHMGGGIVSTIRKCTLALFLRILGVPVVIQLHGPEVEGYLARPVSRFFFRLSLAPANAIAALTPWWAELLASNGVRKPIRVLPNVAPEAAEAEAARPLTDSPPNTRCRILTMSRMVSGKGFDAVVDAMPHVTEPVIFRFAGTGPQEPGLRQKVADLDPAPEVEFLGWVDDAQKPALFSETDIFCLPSRYDSFGMGYVEAMAYGLPVIALRRGAIVDVVGDGEAGLLVAADEPEELAAAIDQLASNHDLKQRMQAAAKKRVLSMYSARAIAPWLQEICTEMS